MAQANDRFVEIFSQNPKFIGSYYRIFVDKVTGVNYLFTQSGNSGGLTPLLNPDGTPVITPIPNKYDE